MSDFTKGPWRTLRLENTDGFGIYPKRTRSPQSVHEIARVWGDQRDSDEVEANARLIAAAPTLYAALEAMLARYATGYNANDNEAEQARAALRRARGDDE